MGAPTTHPPALLKLRARPLAPSLAAVRRAVLQVVVASVPAPASNLRAAAHSPSHLRHLSLVVRFSAARAFQPRQGGACLSAHLQLPANRSRAHSAALQTGASPHRSLLILSLPASLAVHLRVNQTVGLHSSVGRLQALKHHRRHLAQLLRLKINPPSVSDSRRRRSILLQLAMADKRASSEQALVNHSKAQPCSALLRLHLLRHQARGFLSEELLPQHLLHHQARVSSDHSGRINRLRLRSALLQLEQVPSPASESQHPMLPLLSQRHQPLQRQRLRLG